MSTGTAFEDLEIGQSASAQHVVTEGDIAAFADLSGDHNPVHLDEAFAQTTPFKGRIAHGILSGAFISALIATKARATLATVGAVAGKTVVEGEAVLMVPRRPAAS